MTHTCIDEALRQAELALTGLFRSDVPIDEIRNRLKKTCFYLTRWENKPSDVVIGWDNSGIKASRCVWLVQNKYGTVSITRGDIEEQQK